MKALGMLVHVNTITFQNSGKFWKNLEKIGKKTGGNARNPNFCRPKGDHPASFCNNSNLLKMKDKLPKFSKEFYNVKR